MQIWGVELEELEITSIGSWPKHILRIVYGLIAIASLATSYFYLIGDLSVYYAELVSKRQNLQKSFAEKHHQASNLDVYKKQKIALEENLKILTQLLPQDNEEALLLEDISQQSVANKVQFNSIKPSPDEDKGFYIEHGLQLSLQGNYHNLASFLSSVTNMSRLITWHDFTLERPGSQNKDQGAIVALNKELTLDVKAKIYWYKKEEKK